jgi:hypothetical protein
VFNDTNQPTTVPPAVPVEDSVNETPSPLEPYVLAEPPAVMIRTGQKKNDLKPNNTNGPKL